MLLDLGDKKSMNVVHSTVFFPPVFTIDANAYAGSYTKIFMFETPMKIEEANGGPYHTQLLYNNKDQDVVMKDKITHDYVSYDDELQVKGIMGSTIKKPRTRRNVVDHFVNDAAKK
ncbi:hypothetical protein ACFE04_027381 [Oxalis oulophora]